MKANESYQPSESLKSLLRDYPKFKEKRDALDDKMGAARGITQERIDAENEALKIEKAKLNKRKVTVLNDSIFRGMANLTVLLENMQRDPYICDIFEDDIKALFLTESAETKTKPKIPIFLRFVRACVSNPHSDNENVIPDFRFILAYYMQHTIHEMIKEKAARNFEVQERYLYDIVLADMMRAFAWTQFFSREALRSKKFREHRRPASF